MLAALALLQSNEFKLKSQRKTHRLFCIAAHLGVGIHPSTISRYTKRLGITRKKISDDEVLLMGNSTSTRSACA